MIWFRSSAFATGSLVALSAHALIISSKVVAIMMSSPTTNIAVWVTSPMSKVPNPNAPITGQKL